MQGISTKVSAGVLALNAWVVGSFVLFDASWGFQLPQFPDRVNDALLILLTAAIMYFVPEKAFNSITQPKTQVGPLGATEDA